MDELNKSNDCDTIDEVIKPSFLKALLEALDKAKSLGFAEIKIEIQHGRPTRIIGPAPSVLIKDE